MNPAIGELRQDHAAIRAQLTVLEVALQDGGACRVLMPAALALNRRLRAHRRREAQAATTAAREQGRLDEDALDALALDHGAHGRQLWLVTHEARRGASVDASAWTSLCRSMRVAMEMQEMRLFPWLEAAARATEGSIDVRRAPETLSLGEAVWEPDGVINAQDGAPQPAGRPGSYQ